MKTPFKIFVAAFSFAFLMAACGSEENTAENAAETKETQEIELPTETDKTYFATVDKLRIRASADRKSDILGQLKLGQKARFLEEQSENKITVTLGGVEIADYWKKIETKNPRNGQKIVGWVFGGGIKSEGAQYTKTKDGYVRTFENFTRKQIVEMLEIDIADDYIFEGTVAYKKSPDGQFMKQGEFKISGKRQLSEEDALLFQPTVVLTGSYSDALPHGLFQKQFEGFENQSVSKIKFSYGSCLWSSIAGNAKGENYAHREDSPARCTFSYVTDQMLARQESMSDSILPE